MRRKLLQARLLLVLSIFAGLLGACGDNATPVPPTPTTIVATVAPTASPVVLANLPTPRPTTAEPSTASDTTTTAAATLAATSTPRPAPTNLPGKLSILGNDGQLYVYRFNGGSRLVLGKSGQNPFKTGNGQFFTFPTWSKDGSKIAAMGSNTQSGTVVSSDVWVVNADGSGAYKVRDNAQTGGVYLNFSPDGNALTMLVGSGDNLELQLADISSSKATAPKSITKGRPLYTSWSPDDDTLAIHTTNGGSDAISLVSTKSASLKLNPVSGIPGQFRAPAWSGDGQHVAYSLAGAKNGDPEVLVVAGKDGKEQGRINGEGNNLSFNWSPDGKTLAYTSMVQSQSYSNNIFITDPISGKTITATKVVDAVILGFFWSPDGKKLAYISVNSDRTFYTWNVYDVAAKKTTPLVEWIPSDAMAQVLGYFDQYAQSDSVWSPDSKALVFGGWDRATVQQNPSQDTPAVYIVSTEGATAGQVYIADAGDLGFWAK